MSLALVDAKSSERVSSENVVRKHAFNGNFVSKLGVLVHKSGVFNLFEVTYPTGVMSVIFLFEFVTGENRFVCVDNDNKISINVAI